MNADSTSDPTGWCSRLATLVLAQAATAARSRAGSAASVTETTTKPARNTDAVRYRRRISRHSVRIRVTTTQW